jgi:hypothetical protein
LRNDTDTQKSNLLITGNFSLPKQKLTRSIIAEGKEYFPEYDINGSYAVQNVELPILIKKLPPPEPLDVQISHSLERIKNIAGPANKIIAALAATVGVVIGTRHHEIIKKIFHHAKRHASKAGGHVKQAGKGVKDRLKSKPASPTK